MKSKWNKMILFLFGLFVLTGCGAAQNEQAGRSYQIYVVNKDETKVNSYEYTTETTDETLLLQELIEKLQEAPVETTNRAAIPEEIKVESYSWNKDQLTIDFSEEYSELSQTGEVLSRAAIVRTLCQLDQIDYVSFLIGDKELLNASGISVGMMGADQFVENNGSEINSYERTSLRLYFADKTGKLLKAYDEKVSYNSNISMEKLVVEQLVSGPQKEDTDYYATIPTDAKVLSVTVKDGTCYVNFDAGFNTAVEGVSAEATVYSIVNSLSELTNVNKVQISIDGETDVTYQESISLSGALERNYEIME